MLPRMRTTTGLALLVAALTIGRAVAQPAERRPAAHLNDVSVQRHSELPALTLPPLSSSALAVGAFALGALALGALAIGALAVGRLEVGRARFRRLDIDDLNVGRLSVRQERTGGTAETEA
jgi:hypothetical protein